MSEDDRSEDGGRDGGRSGERRSEDGGREGSGARRKEQAGPEAPMEPGGSGRTGKRGDEEPQGGLSDSLKQAGPYMGAAYSLTGGLLGLGLLGYLLDWYIGTSPVFLLVGLSLGLVVGFYELAKVVFQAPKR